MTPLDTALLDVLLRRRARGVGRLSYVFACTLAAFTLVGPLHAQSCSGGNDGGMDATGSLCNSRGADTFTAPTATTVKVTRGSKGATREPRLEKTGSLAARTDLVAGRNAKSRGSLRRGTR